MTCICNGQEKVLTAIMTAQEELAGLEADSVNTHFKSKYASLPGVYEHVKPVLKKYGLFVHHYMKPFTNESQVLRTVIRHRDSYQEFIDERFIISERPGPQGTGGAETYMKRYALLSLLGIALGEKDDDGEAERVYIAKVDKLLALIAKCPNPKGIWDELSKKFDIKKKYEIGDHRLFEAACFVLEYINKDKQ